MCARVKDKVLESLWTAEGEDQSCRVCEWDSVIAAELPARGRQRVWTWMGTVATFGREKMKLLLSQSKRVYFP